jgi:hypothetical protein
VKALVMLAFVLVGAVEASPAPRAEADAVDLNATIHSVDVDAKMVEVVTGIGHALRVYAMRVGPSCQIRVEGGSATLAQLKSGPVVHVRYRRTDAGMVAEAIETLPPLPGGGER